MPYEATDRNREVVTFRSAPVLVRHIRSMHEAATRERYLWLSCVYRRDADACMYVGLGHRRGLYLICNYGADHYSWDLISVGPKGLQGRRQEVEYDYGGDPSTAQVQCIVPLTTACDALTHFLKSDSVPLTLEWVSPTGLNRAFARR